MTMSVSTPTATELEARVSNLEAQAAQVQRELELARMDVRLQRTHEQLERGEGRPAREALEELRKKYNIPCQ
ncbi:MAG: hypothetical protein FWD53_08295 [Phycisphaerales bacterium]|nr:hypothetical protein [Phycisphaerales bacterium]